MTVKMQVKRPEEIQDFSSTGLIVRNPAGTYEYTITAGAITANRALSLPVITGADTLAVLGLAQTLAAKTLTAPDINGGTADSLTALSVRSTGAAYDLTFASAEVLTGGKTLSFNVGDTARTITLSGNPTLADWFDQAVKAASNPTFGNLTITSFAANWTNAGRTVADLGVVTTVDINGGAIDGATIGGTTPAAGTFTQVISNGNVEMDGDGTLFVDSGDLRIQADPENDNAGTYISFETDGTERARFLGAEWLIGYTAALTVSSGDGITDLVPRQQTVGGGQSSASLLLADFAVSDASAATLAFLKSGHATVGSNTVLVDNEYVGRIIAFGADGTDFESPAAEIRFVVDDVGGPTTGQMGGSIEFYTTADGGETLTKALTFTSAQAANFAGAVTVAATKKIHLDGSTAGDSYIYEESADDVHIVVGGSALVQIDQDLGPSIAFGHNHPPLAWAGTRIGGTWTSDGSGTVGVGLQIDSVCNLNAADIAYATIVNVAGQLVTPGGANTYASLVTMRLGEPALTLGAAGGQDVVTDAATLYISSVPTEAAAGSNSGIWMPAGAFKVSDGHGSSGEQLTSGGNDGNLSWTAAGSLREFKNILGRLDPQTALERVVSIGDRIARFTYRDEPGIINTGDFETEYAGVLGEEAPWAMHHGGRIFDPVSAFGHTAAAFAAMQQRIDRLEAKLATA